MGPIWEEAEPVPTQEGFISINEAKPFFINLFNKHLLSTHYVPGPELEKEVSQTQPLPEVAQRSGSERHRGKWSLKVACAALPPPALIPSTKVHGGPNIC